jgi:hypothetical protein
MLCPGIGEELPGDWEALCADVRPIILNKLPLRDLASAASTCREFQGAFRSRLVEEWARLISVGEETYGKHRLSSFAKAVGQLMVSRDGYPGLSPEAHNMLVINAAGEAELLTRGQLQERQRVGQDVLVSYIHLYHRPSPRMFARLWRVLPGGGRVREDANIGLVLFYKREGGAELRVLVNSDAHEAAMGLLLAMCGGNPVAVPASVGNPVAVPASVGNPVAVPACAGYPVGVSACVGNPMGVPACAGNPTANASLWGKPWGSAYMWGKPCGSASMWGEHCGSAGMCGKPWGAAAYAGERERITSMPAT